MIIQGKFKIVSNKKVGREYFKMVVRAPRIAREAQPGQFVHLRCLNSAQPLLRRPLSFHRFDKHNLELLYKVIGQGTNLLAKQQKGDKIDILGPLGNGFQLSAFSSQLSAILVAGGMGVAPLLSLAEALVKRKGKRNIALLVGAQTKSAILGEKDFRRLGLKMQIATDDGSRGHKGVVTDLLNNYLNLSSACARKGINSQLSTIYACGPRPMLKAVAGIARKNKLTAYASLEENMACGVGACLGCAIRTKSGYQRVCKEGPVFNLAEIKWGKTGKGGN